MGPTQIKTRFVRKPPSHIFSLFSAFAEYYSIIKKIFCKTRMPKRAFQCMMKELFLLYLAFARWSVAKNPDKSPNQSSDTDDCVYKSCQQSHWTKQPSNEIELEKSDQAPVQCPNQRQRFQDIMHKCSHFFLLWLKCFKSFKTSIL